MSCTINDYNSYVVVGGQTVYIGGGAGTLAGVTAAPGSSIMASVNVNFSSSMSTGDFTGYLIGFYDNNAGNLPSITSPQVPWLDDATFTLYLTMPSSGDLEGMFMVLDTNYNTLCEGGAFRVVSTGTSQVIVNQCDAFGSCPASNDGASCCNTADGYEYVCHTQSNGGYSWNPGAQCSGGSNNTPACTVGDTVCNPGDNNTYQCINGSYGPGWALAYSGCGTAPSGTGDCTVGTETFSNGQQLCDSNGNLFKCNSGTMDYISSGCNPGGGQISCDFNVWSKVAGVASVGESVSFATYNCVGSPTSYDWDFGDGSAHGSGDADAHTYTTPGNYTVTLRVTGATGTGIVTYNIAVKSTTTSGTGGTGGTGGTTTCTPACPSTQTCTAGKCVPKPSGTPVANTSTKGQDGTICENPSCTASQNCVNGACVAAAGTNTNLNTVGGDGTTCVPACPSSKPYCQSGVCVAQSSSSGSGTTGCSGLDRNGVIDPSCLLDPSNSTLLYGAIGVALVLVILSRR